MLLKALWQGLRLLMDFLAHTPSEDTSDKANERDDKSWRKRMMYKGFSAYLWRRLSRWVDVNTIIRGDPITVPGGTVLIPVSKVAYGFAAGGSDWPSKSNAALFGGGSGAGINITPIAFIVVREDEVRMLHVVSKPDSGDKIANMVPASGGQDRVPFPFQK